MNLNQVTVPSSNIQRSISFYQTLGLKLIVESPHYARFLCPDGNATFSVHLVEELPSGAGISVYFECENLDEKVEELIRKGLVFDQLPKDQTWLWREAYLKDPDGNQLILFFAGENRIDPPWRIRE
ncbi:VOC family protein [Fluviicola sp.]|uniref:VOC family protein n=1 Tax=Fluviicola sp. TaxID=1917219 RepID=UPI0026179E8A|nr:VOC family protein [Fluviicola sp.]